MTDESTSARAGAGTPAAGTGIATAVRGALSGLLAGLLAGVLAGLLAGSLACAATFPLPAQHVVVPAAFEDADGPDAYGVPGGNYPRRDQYLIDPVHLGELRGRTLTGLAFRRNRGGDLLEGRIQMVVRIGVATRPAREAAADFGRNVTGAVEVFRGAVTQPASPESFDPDWSAPNRVDIPFTTPYRVPAAPEGGLCVDLEGQPIGDGAFWPIDATSDAAVGDTISVGRACGPLVALLGPRTAHAHRHTLVPGSTAILMDIGPRGTATFAMLATRVRANPIDLAFLGAPGCELYVDPFATVGGVYGPPVYTREEYGSLAFLVLPLPASRPELLGASFVVQWAAATTPITTSNALICMLSPVLPTLGIGKVTQSHGATPAVDVTYTPVMRFTVR